MKKLFTLMLIGLLTLTMTSCSKKQEDVTPTEGGVIKLGASGPLTGSAAEYGIAVKAGAEIAVDEINAKDGIKLELNFLDDEADGEKSSNCYAQLKDWGMQVSMLTVTTGAALAVTDQYEEDGIFALTPSGSAEDIIKPAHSFRMCFADPEQGTASAKYIADNKLGSKVAIFYQKDDAYSSGVYETFVTACKDNGLDVVYTYAFTDANSTDFPVQEAKNNGADVIFLPLYYGNDTKIIMACKQIDYSPVFFGIDGFDGALNQEGVSVDVFENVYYLAPFAYAEDDSQAGVFTAKFKDKMGFMPNQFAADGYDVVYAIYDAICEVFDPAKDSYDITGRELGDRLVAKFNGGYTYSGLTGSDMTWSQEGAVVKTPNVYQIKDGKPVMAD